MNNEQDSAKDAEIFKHGQKDILDWLDEELMHSAVLAENLVNISESPCIRATHEGERIAIEAIRRTIEAKKRELKIE